MAALHGLGKPMRVEPSAELGAGLGGGVEREAT